MYLAMLSVLPLGGISLIFWNNYWPAGAVFPLGGVLWVCLLYTSDAADERSSVDLGGGRIIKKKIKNTIQG